MLLTIFNIDNTKFYVMQGNQDAYLMARYIRKNKLKPMNEQEKNNYIEKQARKNNGLIVNEILTKAV